MSQEKNTEAVAEEVATQEVAIQEVLKEEVVAEKAPANKKAGEEVKIQFLLSPTGKFQLAYNVGEVVKINELQANELVEAGYAEIVK